MGIARSTYYDRPQARIDDTTLVGAIAGMGDELEAYGWRRVRAALRQQGITANHKRIRRLMREHGLQPKLRRRFVRTTDSDHAQPIFRDRRKEIALDGPDRLPRAPSRPLLHSRIGRRPMGCRPHLRRDRRGLRLCRGDPGRLDAWSPGRAASSATPSAEPFMPGSPSPP